MEEHRRTYCIETMSRVLRVLPSGYYHWRSHQSSSYRQRNIYVLAEIQRIVKDSRETYGSPRVHRELGKRGFPCNRKRVAKLMHDNHIQAKARKRYRVTTNSSKTRNASPNVVRQEFHATRPNQLWTSDMTFVWTREPFAGRQSPRGRVRASRRRVWDRNRSIVHGTSELLCCAIPLQMLCSMLVLGVGESDQLRRLCDTVVGCDTSGAH
jgi:transposase InsO family protein